VAYYCSAAYSHEVKLIAPLSRPTMRFVPAKSAEQQAALMMVGLRDRLIRNRTQLSNAIRGYAAEFDFTAARRMALIDPLLDRIQADESVPVLARELFAAQSEEYAQLQAQIAEADAKLMAWHKADECSRRLANIPCIGPIGAATASLPRLSNRRSGALCPVHLELPRRRGFAG
jgi:transposase